MICLERDEQALVPSSKELTAENSSQTYVPSSAHLTLAESL